MLRSIAICLVVAPVGGLEAEPPGSARREPIAIVRVKDEVVVANRETGTLAILDATTHALRREIPVAKRLAALAVRPGEAPQLLACDDTRHELLRLENDEGDDGTWRVVARIPVARYPVDVVATRDRAIVASSWSRRLTLVDLDATDAAEPRTLDLPFVPGRQLPLPDGRLVVAAAFDGRLALVDLDELAVVETVELVGHNIGGLAHDPRERRLLVTQAMLRDDTGTTYENVFWGGVLKNVLQAVSLDELERGTIDHPADLTFLGFPSDAAGDPGAVAVTPSGGVLVAIAGVDAVHLRSGPTAPFEALDTGRRPIGIALADDGRTAFVANTYDDTITLLDVAKLEQAGTISLGPAPEPTLVERGENLFHDARLSLDGWYSCHTCHTNGHTSDQRTDNLGDGDFGDPKRIPTLLGTHGTGPWAWNGASPSLEGQIEKSILKTMRGEVARVEDVAALAAYVRSLAPAPSLAAAREESALPVVARGRDLFRTRGCTDCHAGERLTSAEVYDVGLRDGIGNREFNPPSLLGVSQRSAFLHDGRAESLRSLLAEHGHPNGATYGPAEIEALLAFLRSR